MTAAAHVVDATRPGSAAFRYFVESASTPGAWRRVDFLPGEHLVCSCPRGRFIERGDILNSKSCRHAIAVLAHVEALAAEQVA